MNVSELAQASVAQSIWQLQPEYHALLVVAEGLIPGPSDHASDEALSTAEHFVRHRLNGRDHADVAELAVWRAAYRSFGAKPQRTRPSVEALLKRLDAGLPRVNRLTDIYNATSIACLLPVGGEDLDSYAGPPRLVRADGGEHFDTQLNGKAVRDAAEPGEAIWRDDIDVTCRRWNWRQGTRTRITDTTTRALFILDWLPVDDLGQTSLHDAGRALADTLADLNPGVAVTTRTLSRTCPARDH